MILRDEVSIIKSGGFDRYGDPLPAVTYGPFPASVQPLSTEEKFAAPSMTETRVNVILGPKLPGVDGAWSSADKILHTGTTYEVEGVVVPHRVAGRVHHHELIAKRIGG